MTDSRCHDLESVRAAARLAESLLPEPTPAAARRAARLAEQAGTRGRQDGERAPAA